MDELRAFTAEQPALTALDPAEYAAGHALFEARSDQRERLTEWLVEHLAVRAESPARVLSIGCGDGTVDARIAAALAAQGRHVEYVGVEPHRPSGQAFLSRLDAVAGVHASVLGGPFASVHPSGSFDVVLAVHSLYYVDDLRSSLRRAWGLLRAGGVLVILHAPLGPLNQLVRLLAPGRRQAFSDEVVAELDAIGLSPQVTRIENRLDLTDSGNAADDQRLLAFTVQARLTPRLQQLVRAALAEQVLPGAGLCVAHPVDALVVHA